MKTKALAIAALTIITLFASCEKKIPQNTETALTQISAQPVAENHWQQSAHLAKIYQVSSIC